MLRSCVMSGAPCAALDLSCFSARPMFPSLWSCRSGPAGGVVLRRLDRLASPCLFVLRVFRVSTMLPFEKGTPDSMVGRCYPESCKCYEGAKWSIFAGVGRSAVTGCGDVSCEVPV